MKDFGLDENAKFVADGAFMYEIRLGAPPADAVSAAIRAYHWAVDELVEGTFSPSLQDWIDYRASL